MADEVKTTFIVEDKASGPLAQIEKQSAKLAMSSEKAQGATKNIGTKAQQMRATRVGSEQFQVDKEEMLARRAGVRHVKLHMQKEMLLHRAAETAIMMAVGEENKYAKQISKYGAGAQMLGAQMAGVGGTVGKLGGTLASLGGYAAIAGIGVEALSFIDEVTGNHIEHAGMAAYNWAQHLMGVTKTTADLEEEAKNQAKYLGYKNVADYKAGKTTARSAELQDSMNGSLQSYIRHLEAAGEKLPETEAERAELVNKMARSIAGPGSAIEFEVAQKASKEELEHSTLAITDHALKEAELAETERKAIAHINMMPWNASIMQQKAHIEEVHKYVNSLRKSKELNDASAAVMEQALLAKTQEQGSIQSMVDQYEQKANAEALMEAEVRDMQKTLPKVHHGMKNELFNRGQLNAAIKQATLAYAAKEGVTPEMTKLFQEKLTMAKSPDIHFNNARFDIKQAFAEGFDPDRIAVAFTNDLVKLAEHSLESKLSAPIYGKP